MKLRAKYIINERTFIYVECDNQAEVDTVKELNRDAEAFIKSEKRYNGRTGSFDHCVDEDGVEGTFEPAAEFEHPIERLIRREKLNSIYDALKLIPERQAYIFIQHCMNDVSFRQLGRELSIDHKTASRDYDQAVKRIQFLTEKFK